MKFFLPKIFGYLFILLCLVYSSRITLAAKLADGLWQQSGSPGTTTVTFTTNSTTIPATSKVVLTFPDTAVISSSGTSISINGQSTPLRINRASGNQIVLVLSDNVSPNTQLNISMANALSSYDDSQYATESVGINILDNSENTQLEYGLAVIPNYSTTVISQVPTDIDSDGLPNWWELLYGLDPDDPNDNILDFDNDNLTNLQEYVYGTNPLNRDTDGGGVWDDREIYLKKNPLDGSDDFSEIRNRSEIKAPSDPRSDSDGDGISNIDEKRYGTNVNSIDTDNDGLNDYEELFTFGTNPKTTDSDGDSLNDYDELKVYQTNPLSRDSDVDGLLDYDEIFIYKTNPTYWDTDNGGMSDRDEIINESNPLFKNDDFQFAWTIYHGNEPSDLFKIFNQNKITTYQGTDLTLEAIKPEGINKISITFNDKSYTTQKDFIKLKVNVPDDPGFYPIKLDLHSESGKIISITRFVELKRKGVITKEIESIFKPLYDRFNFFDKSVLDSALIEIYKHNNTLNKLELYDSVTYTQANPQYTSLNGTFLTILEPGDYLIKISKKGLGNKELLFSTNKYTFYSPDITFRYNYDYVIWSIIFIIIYTIVWYIQTLIEKIGILISFSIRNLTKSKKAHR